MTHRCLRGELPQQWTLLTMILLCCHGDRQQPGQITDHSHAVAFVYLKTNSQSQTHEHMQAQLTVKSFFLNRHPSSFPAFVTEESFRMKECCWLQERKRWGQNVYKS